MGLSCLALRRLRPVLVVCGAAALITIAEPAPAGHAATICTKYASVNGNDAGAGTLASPFRTGQKLATSLAVGQTGCLTGGGTFVGNVNFASGGAADSRVTLTSDPATARATINGIVYVAPTAPYVTIDNLKIDATNASQVIAVQLFADYAKLTNSEVYGADQDRIGVQIGYQNTVLGVEIASNRIHDFGIPTSFYDQGIYVDLSDGAIVRDNYIYDNSGGYGIQLWTHSMNGHFLRNTIDGNGPGNVIISGQQNANGAPSSNNEFDHNIFSNPGSGKNVVIFWSSYPSLPTGTGNVVHDNVSWAGSLDSGPTYCSGSCSGVTYTNNPNVNPSYVDRAGKNFVLAAGSAAAGYGVGAVVAPAPPPPPVPLGTSSIAAGATLLGTVTWTVTTTSSVFGVEFTANGVTVGTAT